MRNWFQVFLLDKLRTQNFVLQVNKSYELLQVVLLNATIST